MSNACPRFSIILTALLLTIVTATSADGQEFSPMPAPVTGREPNFGIYAAEAGGGVLGGALGLTIGSIVGAIFFYDPQREMSFFNGVILVGFPMTAIGCAGGTYGVGSAFRQEGRFLPTLAWGLGSGALGFGLFIAGIEISNTDVNVGPVWYMGASVVALGAVAPIALTTLGYNLSRPKESVGSRFLPGSVALGSVTDADGTAHPSLDVRLVNVRF